MTRFRILFVCMGNICRSPSAHGVFQRQLTDHGLDRQVEVDSAGTHNYHPGEAPDERSQRHAARRGYDLSQLRARQIEPIDFECHHLILAMDWDNLHQLKAQCPREHQHKLRRLTEFCLRLRSDTVPDPYYGGAQGFEHVLDLVEDASAGLLQHLQRQLV